MTYKEIWGGPQKRVWKVSLCSSWDQELSEDPVNASLDNVVRGLKIWNPKGFCNFCVRS